MHTDGVASRSLNEAIASIEGGAVVAGLSGVGAGLRLFFLLVRYGHPVLLRTPVALLPYAAGIGCADALADPAILGRAMCTTIFEHSSLANLGHFCRSGLLTAMPVI